MRCHPNFYVLWLRFSTLTEVFVLWLRFFLNWLKFSLHWLRFFCVFFFSCKAKARVKLTKTGHGLHSSTLVVIYVVRLLFVLFYTLFVCKCVLSTGDNPIAVNKHIIYHIIYNIIYHIISYHIISYHIISYIIISFHTTPYHISYILYDIAYIIYIMSYHISYSLIKEQETHLILREHDHDDDDLKGHF